MKKINYQVLIASLLFFVLAPLTAFAQGWLESGLDVDIPFQFYAGDTLLPAGTYTITTVDDDPVVLRMRDASGRTEVLLLTEPTEGETPAAQANLVFNKVGNHEFLSQVWGEGVLTGYNIVEPRLEQRLKQKGMSSNSHTVGARNSKKK